ncbi:MAG TPA: sensor histidine kinase [Ignavibacteria bacterium]|nr:sensor histidine kinase [Ignavibacteria bacterium]
MLKELLNNYIFRKYFNHFVVFLLAVLIVTLSYTIYKIYNITLDEAKRMHQRQQMELAKSASNGIRFYMEHLVRDIKYASLHAANPGELENLFYNQTERHIVKSIFVASEAGELITIFGDELPPILNSIFSDPNYNLSGRASSGLFYSEIYPSNPDEDPGPLFFIMLTENPETVSRQTTYTGFIISFDWLMQQFIAPLKLSDSDFAWVLDDTGRLIYHPRHEEMLFRSIYDYSEDCAKCHNSFDVQRRMLVNLNGLDEYIIGDEPTKIMAYQTIQIANTKWILAISTYLPAIIDSIKSNFILVFISAGIAIVIIIFFGTSLYVTNLRRIKAEETEKYLEQTRDFQEKLHHAAKLASIGELVDSVAHEINTPTGIISAEIDTLSLHDCDPKNCMEELRIIKDQTRRIGNYTKSLLSYSRRMPFQPKTDNIVELVEECLFLLKPKIKAKKIIIDKQFENDIPSFIFDRGRIEQVIVNIVNNAIDFITDDPLITITIKKIVNKNDEPESDFILIGIKDNGKGIPESDYESIFEPFFSTKSLSNGTGLGLSISKAIVNRHKGKIEVESKVGSGTTFNVYLPMIIN